jgi:hypothetical protein
MVDRAFVLGLSGVQGADKMTMTRRLMQDYPKADLLRHDDYQTITRMSSAETRAWFDRGADPNEFALTELVDELARRARIPGDVRPRPLLLFETPLGRRHHATGAFIDFLVWIDTPFDVALSRTLLRFIDQAQRDAAPNAKADFLKWLRNYLARYEGLRAMYVVQRDALLPSADLVVGDGEPVEVSVERIRKALLERGVACEP